MGLTISPLVETLGTASNSDSLVVGKVPSLLVKTRVRGPHLSEIRVSFGYRHKPANHDQVWLQSAFLTNLRHGKYSDEGMKEWCQQETCTSRTYL